jgi:DNA-directed RNA polymerase specialized sigma24 family protein
MSGSASRPAGSAVDAEIAHARVLLREHASPLFAIASLLLDDGDAAAQVVVDVIADATLDTLIGGDTDSRALLAGAVYVRCLALLSSRDRYAGQPSPEQASAAAAVLARLSLRHRAVICLVLIGGQDAGLAARTLGVSQQTVETDLLHAIEHIHTHKASQMLRRPASPEASNRHGRESRSPG